MWSDNETSEDLLGFKVHANLLINVINDETVLPVSIGVFGEWGSGKSSILKMVYDELSKKSEDTLVLYFNGWVFEGYDDAKAALLESIIKGFEKNEKIKEKVKGEIKKLLKSVDWMRVVGFSFKNIVVPTASAMLTGGVSLIPHLAQGLSSLGSKEIIEKISSGNTEELLSSLLKDKDISENVMLVRNFRDDFSKLIEKSKVNKLVVIIDDLDRCTPDRIIENLEAIKLFLNVEKTAFLIGADTRIVRHAIEHRFKPKVDPENNNGRIVDDYLEKLIQLPYNLPKLSDSEVETYLSLLICKRELKKDPFDKITEKFNSFRESNRYTVFGLSDIKELLTSEEHELVSKSLLHIPEMSSLISQSLYGNPRQIKRFLNTFTLRKRLAKVANIKDFNEMILAKLMILEYSEPNLFKKIYEWQSLQKGVAKEIKDLEQNIEGKSGEEIKTYLESFYKDWSAEKIIKWLQVEPKLINVDLSDYYWITRDKISSSIAGASLIPPIVKNIFSELEQDSISESIIKTIIKDKVIKLSELESTKFLDYAGSKLKAHATDKKYFDIFHCMVEEEVPKCSAIYRDILSVIDLKDVPPSVAVSLKRFSEHPDFKTFLPELFKSSHTKVAKAFNIAEE